MHSLWCIHGDIQMRKKSSYRPKGVRLDNMSWVRAGFKPVGSVPKAGVHLKLGNMEALDALINGHGEGVDSHTMREAFDMALCLPQINPRLGADWLPELKAARDAAYAMHDRGEATGRFLFTGPEMQAVKQGMEVHIQQLEECTVLEMEKALKLVISQKKKEQT
jgi:hypothetical protein